jgi:hypothetical protein
MNPDEPSPSEVVLGPGESMTAVNKSGRFTVSYVSPLVRRYEFDGRTKTAKQIARPERFDGKLGLYDPAGAWTFAPPEFRLLTEEAERHFEDYEQLYRALHLEIRMDWVYTQGGLVAGYYKLSAPDHFDVYWISLFQFYVAGKKPTNLKGARDSEIRLARDIAVG